MTKFLKYLCFYIFYVLAGSFEGHAQVNIVPEMIFVNDTLFAGKFEVTVGQWKYFLDNIQDSLKISLMRERKRNIEFYENEISFLPLSPTIDADYQEYYRFMNYPLTFVTSKVASEYILWLNENDSTYEYYAPRWLDYLALYGIKENEELRSIAIDGSPRSLNFDSLSVSESEIDLNRNYFPWGTSIYGTDNVLFANLCIPFYYLVSEISRKSFNSRRQAKIYSRYETLPVGSFKYNYKGIYDLQGNVAELIFNTEFTYGGSCCDPDPRSAYIGIFKRYHSPNPFVGFRVFAKPKQKFP